jgi:tripartite ATP-independent transporter DctP family solute receptor
VPVPGQGLIPTGIQQQARELEPEGTMIVSRRHFMAGSAIALAGGLTAWPARAAKFTFKIATENAATDPVVARLEEAAAGIAKATNGDVELRVFPSGQLGGGTDLLSQVRSGAVEFMVASSAVLSTVVPTASINSLGFAFSDYGKVWAAMDGSLGAFIREQTAKGGQILLMDKVWDNGFRQITSGAKQIAGPDDLKGFKIRVPPSPLYTSMFKALGAAPTAIPFSELYTSLQTKLVEGQENPLLQIEVGKLYEVQKFIAMTNHMWDGFWLVGNQRAWSRLPEDHRKIVAQHINDAALKQRQDVQERAVSAADRLKKAGMTIGSPDPNAFRAALAKTDFYATWKQNFGADAWKILEQNVGTLS